MIAVHDPRVVGVWNFQSSALLIIGIYPSRYHENKFPSKRSTGKIKQNRRSAASSSSLTFLRRLLLLLLVYCLLFQPNFHRFLTNPSSHFLLFFPIYLTPLSSASASSSSLHLLLSLTHTARAIVIEKSRTLVCVGVCTSWCALIANFYIFYSPRYLSLLCICGAMC